MSVRVSTLLIWASAGVAGGLAAPIQLPVISEVVGTVASTHPALVTTHDNLTTERTALAAAMAKMSADCHDVIPDSAKDHQCGLTAQTLTGRAAQHCQRSVMFASEYGHAVAEVLAANRSQRQQIAARFETQKKRLLSEAATFERWRQDAEARYDDAIRVAAGAVGQQLLSAVNQQTEQAAIEQIDATMQRLARTKNVKYVRRAELKQYVISLKAELRGTTAPQAKQIVLKHLERDKRTVKALSLVTDHAIEALRPDSPLLAADGLDADGQLDLLYSALQTATELAADYGVRAVQTLAESDLALGIIGVAPDILRLGLLVGEAFIDGTNVDALDALRASTALEHAQTVQRTKHLLQERLDLETVRTDLAKASQFVCPGSAIASRTIWNESTRLSSVRR